MNHITLRVRALIVSEEQVLLCELPSRGVSFLPGGRVEPGETLIAALKREVLEETGSPVEDIEYLGAVEDLWHEGDQPIHDLSHFFEVSASQLRPPIAPACDDAGVLMRWVPFRDIGGQPIQPESVKRLILRWLSGEHWTWWAYENRQ